MYIYMYKLAYLVYLRCISRGGDDPILQRYNQTLKLCLNFKTNKELGSIFICSFRFNVYVSISSMCQNFKMSTFIYIHS